MSADKHTESQILDVQQLPTPDAKLADIINFIDPRDPAAKFRELWGAEYVSNAENLWSECVKAFAEQRSFEKQKDELLLCLKYDCAVAAYLSRPESKTLEFYQWIIEKIRDQ